MSEYAQAQAGEEILTMSVSTKTSSWLQLVLGLIQGYRTARPRLGSDTKLTAKATCQKPRQVVACSQTLTGIYLSDRSQRKRV
eukprot:6185358-Pleurochrysis_carterae.AAC.3